MNILTIKQFDEEFLPLLPEKFHVNAILQRKSGMRAFETRLKIWVLKDGKKIARPLVTPLNIDFGRRTLVFRGKKGKKREVPTKINMDIISSHYNNGYSPAYSGYHAALKKVFLEIGHEPWSPDKNRMVTHCLRVYFILDWITRFGTTLVDLQELIGITGHKSVKELQPYIDALGTESGVQKYHELF